jgi:predicted amidophosphoribosyltransferase
MDLLDTGNLHFLESGKMALSSCPKCRKELSETALNCPNCGWHKSRAGLVVAWIVAIVMIALGLLFYYQIESSKQS